MAHRPKKRFGQNFLQDPWIIDAILTAFHPEPSSHVVEIGPGLGALTKPLLQHLQALTAIEVDTDLCERLKEMPGASLKLNLVMADALTVDYSQLGEQLRLIGNLPYNISTPLILHVLRYARHIEDMHWMLQKEVVDRLAASPGCKAYGRLSVAVQYHCEVEPLFLVPATAFFPQPKVESAMVRLIPYQVSPYPAVNFSDLERLVATSFSMRRKTLANNLKSVLIPSDWATLGIDSKQRPEQISVTDYVHIAKYIAT
ncbi:MAG: 16S rRNA (adenine(1518)-N(6)/adenine(1519)-N(6))-dimethyltransferase RsmA [Legionellales bacterium]|nr:16S rRNA (adenine(1518)-N(6)/adenine(1519)-N(6))-dimethyltransferase RsmA [Legionellales bacterium]